MVPARLSRRRDDPRGQAFAELVIILPLLLLLVGGIIQYGVLISTRHALIQIGRDVGRWAATQEFDPCRSGATDTPPQPVTEANSIAVASGLLGYSDGDWSGATFKPYDDDVSLPPTPPWTSGVEVVWSIDSGDCPPTASTETSWVTIRLSHHAPVLLPGLAYLPGIGTCAGSDCYLPVTTTAKFRMEPNQGP